MSAEEKFQLNKSIDINLDEEDNDHIPKPKKPLIFQDSKTVRDHLDHKISVDQVLMGFNDGRSLHSLSPDQLQEIDQSQDASKSPSSLVRNEKRVQLRYHKMQEQNYNKFLYKAQKLEHGPGKKKKGSKIKQDRSCKSQLDFEDPNNLKKQLKQQQKDKGLDKSIDFRPALSEVKESVSFGEDISEKV